MKKDEKQPYDILEKGISFKNGHYEVGMLWKDSNIHLKNSKELTVLRLENLKERLIKNPDKAKQYSDTIRKYLELGHPTKLSIYTNKQNLHQQTT